MHTSSFGAAANTTGNVVMYADVYHAYEELVFRGIELDLVLFEILVLLRRHSVCVFCTCFAVTRHCPKIRLYVAVGLAWVVHVADVERV